MAKKKSKGSEKLPPLPDRRVMEGAMFGMFGRAAGSLGEAQSLIYRACEEKNPERRIEMAFEAIRISPDCADAFVLLAEEAPTLDEAMELYGMGVEAGERAIGEKRFEEDAGHFWGVLETRPYMRARLGLAQCLWLAGGREQAVDHCQDMLRLNPNDNQGVRWILMTWLLELRRNAEAAALLEQYDEDASAQWGYATALLEFRKKGDTPASRKLLKKAFQANRHVPDYLLGRRKTPRRLPDYIGFGDEDEAVAYAAESSDAWRETPGAREWLEAALDSYEPPKSPSR